MAGTIRVRDLRNIKKLDFLIPDRGVWLLTAGNGAGKTSLLACLRRIGHPNSFQIHFASSLRSDRLDNHSNGSVTYEINGEEVEYAYRGERWTPRPRSNANLFDRFGYSSVTYIGANADRITPRPEDFETRNIRTANSSIISAANEIFETNKFLRLRVVNLSRGVGNEAFVLALDTSPVTYHSEKHFSLGELCVLKLLRLITQVNNNSMIIVDELEMALHPRAQVKLLRYLEIQARNKSLTIVFSTHSVTLLKTVNRRQIIYLETQDNGDTRPVVGCYPTYAIGNIAADEETLPDIVLYVEDVFARDVSTAFFEMFADERFQDPTERPTTKIIPVGGFQEVISFFDRNRSILPEQVVQKALLDNDVSTETMANWQTNNNHSQLAKFARLDNYIKFLPFTPEVGLLDFISDNLQSFESRLRDKCGDHQLRIGNIIGIYDRTLQGARRRDAAKHAKDELSSYIEQRTQRGEDSVREMLSGIFAQLSWTQYRPEFMRLFGQLIR